MSVGPWQVVIIVAVLVLLFGATKLPKLARSLGESARIFKAETQGLREDDKSAETDGQQTDTSAAGPEGAGKQLPGTKQQPMDAETVEENQRDSAG